MPDSEEITRNAKSNLAFTLMDLPEERRIHMAQFYAFCRLVDDIVDEPGMSTQLRLEALSRWELIITQRTQPESGVEQEVAQLVAQLSLDTEPMLELIEGCRSDLDHKQPQTREDLLAYAWRVAACVGITSAAVMGASEAARPYAVALGYALQMVNIMRDVAEDYAEHQRIYLPAADMELFGVSAQDLAERKYSYRLRELMAYQAALAEKFFGEADEHYQQLSSEDRAALIPAQAMSLIYHNILTQMRDDEYKIFDKRYSVNSFRKLWFLLRARMSTVSLPRFPSVSEWGFFKNKDAAQTPESEK